eukprot:1604103-Rhodomonas_salina.1
MPHAVLARRSMLRKYGTWRSTRVEAYRDEADNGLLQPFLEHHNHLLGVPYAMSVPHIKPQLLHTLCQYRGA